MIITECPYCDEVQCISWNRGGYGYFPYKCDNCNDVMWVEGASFDGYTRTHENFKKEIMKSGDEKKIEDAYLETKEENNEKV